MLRNISKCSNVFVISCLDKSSEHKDVISFKHEQLININNSVLSNSNTMNVSFILDINPNISNISNLNSTDLESTLLLI